MSGVKINKNWNCQDKSDDTNNNWFHMFVYLFVCGVCVCVGEVAGERSSNLDKSGMLLQARTLGIGGVCTQLGAFW